MLPASDAPVLVALYCVGDVERYRPVLRSLRAAVDAPLVAVGPAASDLAALVEVDAVLVADDLVGGLSRLLAEQAAHVLLVSEPVIAPPELLANALGMVEADGRVA